MFHTYKKIGAALIAVLLIAALAACGNSSDTKGSSEKEETITYKAENGNIKIPKHPKRVVVMADGYYGDFKQLGINVLNLCFSGSGFLIPFSQPFVCFIFSACHFRKLFELINVAELVIFNGDCRRHKAPISKNWKKSRRQSPLNMTSSATLINSKSLRK